MLRPATDADQENVRTWRNHDEVRAVSLTQHVISADEHAAWWANTKDNPSRHVLIYERGGVPSGVVTFFDLDVDAKTSWWGYYLDNDGLTARGELLPAWIQIQREAVKYADAELGLDSLDAEVLEINEGVRRFNKRNGFTELETQNREIGGEDVAVIHVRRERPRTDRQEPTS